VMTVSFHKYGEYFPGTGDLRDIGIAKGRGYALNFPLRDGLSDDNFQSIFEPVITQVMQSYNPTAVVLQCGTDSLSGDKLGCFNLSMRGHANCVSFVKKFNLPLLLVGGGGYTMRNVARAWAYETGLAAGVRLGSEIPVNEYYEYFGPDYKLDVRSSNMEDLNGREYLDRVRSIVTDRLRDLGGPPGVQMMDIPRLSIDDRLNDLNKDEDMLNPDIRRPQSILDRRVQADGELSDSDDEGEGGRRNHMDGRMRIGAGFGIMEPINKEKGPSVHHHLSAAFGVGSLEEPSNAATPKDLESLTDEDQKMEIDGPEDSSTTTTVPRPEGAHLQGFLCIYQRRLPIYPGS